MKKKTLLFLIVPIVCLFSSNAYGEEGNEGFYEEVAGIEELVENYEKTPIEDIKFDLKTRILSGNSTIGSMISIDTGDSMVIEEDGLFQFEIPKDFKMVTINSVNSDGGYPNSVSYNLEENKLIAEGDETISPDIKEEIATENKNEEKKEKKEEVQSNSTDESLTTQTREKKSTYSESEDRDKEQKAERSFEKQIVSETKNKFLDSKLKIVISIIVVFCSIIGVIMYLVNRKRKALKKKKRRKKRIYKKQKNKNS